MKRLIYIFTFLFVALSAMAHNLGSGTYIYYDNTEYNWTTNKIFFMIGHRSWSQGYEMAKIKNTNLYFVKMPKWDGYTQWAVFGADNVWGGEGNSVAHRKQNCGNSTNVGTVELKSHNLIHNDGTCAVDTWHAFLNKTYTLECALNENNVDNVGEINVKYYTFEGNEAVTFKDVSFSSKSSLIYPALTSQITLTATPNEGYHFVKWSDGNTNASRIITVTENTTYEAIFDKLCEFDELTEGTVYYIAAEKINVANKYDKASIDMEKTSVDGLYQVTIPKGYFDRFVIGDKTFTSAQISTNQYYNDMEWLPFEASLDIPNKTPNSGLFGPITYQKTISGDDVNKWHWISLPYNVKISNIQGGEYGTDFIIQEYNTAERAEWKDNIAANNKSAWRQMGASETLLAGKGYILAVDNEKSSSYTLTFVSETDLNVVADQFEGYNTDFSSGVTESANWHLIGTGVYGNAGGYENVNYVAKPDATGADYTYHFLGKELASNFNPTLLGVGGLEPYTAFFVQHTGDYSFSKAQPAQNAAPRRARAEEVVEQYYVNIVGMADTSHTAIFLAEDGSDDYVVGKDFLHLGASGTSLQLYTLQGESTLSFNYLKREDRTVLVGGYVAQSGKYTISLDGNGEASSVLLYDMETGLVADLLNENYEFEAEKGILDGRFSVIISYAAGDGPATELENDMTMKVVALNCDGIARFEGLSIGENVAIYDVVGRCVTQFVAESDKADVMLTSGVYVLYHNGETIKFVVNR